MGPGGQFGQSEPWGAVPRLGSEGWALPAGQGCYMPLTRRPCLVCAACQTHSASRPHDLFTVQAVMRCSPSACTSCWCTQTTTQPPLGSSGGSEWAGSNWNIRCWRCNRFPLCLGQGHNPKLWPPTPLHTLSARPLIIEMYPLHVRTPNTSVVINLNWKLVLDWGVWN